MCLPNEDLVSCFFNINGQIVLLSVQFLSSKKISTSTTKHQCSRCFSIRLSFVKTTPDDWLKTRNMSRDFIKTQNLIKKKKFDFFQNFL